MIVSCIHSSMDTPPQVPMITGCTPKRKRSDNFKDTIISTATAVMEAVTAKSHVQTPQIQQTVTHNHSWLLKSGASHLIS